MDLFKDLLQKLGLEEAKPIGVCEHCNKSFKVKYSHQLYCSHKCRNLSRRKTNDYVKVTIEGKRKREPVVKMETKLGIKLYSHEEVHHKNGIKSDNSDSNLELWSISHPPGQRIEDKLKWCKDFIFLYECKDKQNNYIQGILSL